MASLSKYNMWNKPWTFKEGFLIGGGLIFAGLMPELSIENIKLYEY